MQTFSISRYLPPLSVKVAICYISIALAILMILVNIPGVFPIGSRQNSELHQIICGICNGLFGLFGFVVMIRTKKIVLAKSDTSASAHASADTLKIKNAFPRWKDSPDEIVLSNYWGAVKESNQAISAFSHIWIAWALFYTFNLIKNINFFHEAIWPQARQYAYYFFETFETLSNNWVGLFAFILYLRFNSVEGFSKQSEKIAKSSVILISLIQLSLVMLPMLNPLKVNLFFKMFGSIANALALCLLFSRLCSKSVNPGLWFAPIFFVYVIIQPLILLTTTEAIILRMPPDVKKTQAREMVDSIGVFLKSKEAWMPGDSLKIQEAATWLAKNSDSLILALDYADLDIRALHKILQLTPLSFASGKICGHLSEHQRVDLIEMENIGIASNIRRWYLLFGKAWFLVFLIWFFEDRRIVRYFMSISGAQQAAEDAAFEANKIALP